MASGFDTTAGMSLQLEQLAAELDVSDVDETVEGSLRLACRLLKCDVASISVHRDSPKKIETTTATDPRAEQSHELQQELGEGPCVEARWGSEEVDLTTDLLDEQRWPRWAPRAARFGLRSALAVKLFTTRDTIGVLDLYFGEPRDFDVDDVDAARAVAARVSAALAHAKNNQQLRDALDSRAVIGQAQGILMERFGISSDRAFAVLRRYSQDQNRRLRLVAQDLATGRRLPHDS